jgi:hypothetical protein
METGMLLIVGTVRLPPENLDRARKAMRAMIAAAAAEDGCVDYGYAEDVLEPGLIHVKEFWRDRARSTGILPPPTLPNGGPPGPSLASATAIWLFMRSANRRPHDTASVFAISRSPSACAALGN